MHNGSDHQHTHAHAHAENLQEATALLTYMLEHNEHHAEELHALMHDVEHFGKEDAAKQLSAALTEFTGANATLRQAVALLKGE